MRTHSQLPLVASRLSVCVCGHCTTYYQYGSALCTQRSDFQARTCCGLTAPPQAGLVFAQSALGSVPFLASRLGRNSGCHDSAESWPRQRRRPRQRRTFRSRRSSSRRTSFHIPARWTMKRKRCRRPIPARRRRQARFRDAELQADHWRAHAGAGSSSTLGSGSTPRSGRPSVHCGGPSGSCRSGTEVGRHELRHRG